MTILLLYVSHSLAFAFGFALCGLLCQNKGEE